MRPDYSDMRLYEDLTGLNRGFLGLLIGSDPSSEAPVLGLDAVIAAQLRRLSPTELEFIAGAPGLLVCFAQQPTASLMRVAETSFSRKSAQTVWHESVRLYATGLLTYLWQVEQRDWRCCALCAGSPGQVPEPLAEFDADRICATANLAAERLHARFAGHPSFWNDLIRSARSGDEEFRALSRLTLIPLVLAEECSSG